MKLTIFIKNVLADLMYYSGVSQIRHRIGRGSVILGYHHVIHEQDTIRQFLQPGMYVTTKTFDMHIRFLSQRYKIISLERLEDLQIKNACIITFDDGWADNYHYAFPILKKYQVPATIFLATNMIGSDQWPWPDRISLYIHNASKGQKEKIFNIIGKALNNDIYTKNIGFKDKYIITEYIISCIKHLDHQEINVLTNKVDKLMYPLSEDLRGHRPWLSWNEINEMSHNNISFGSHTSNHTILTNTSLINARNEIMKSLQVLSNKSGKPVKLFSYPNGNYNNNIISILKEYGIKIAVCTDRGTISKSNNLLTLKRVLIHNDMTSSIPLFAYKLY
jgi:peptidoglycan/xylan/chitin deacetylase (PgdA/CDA1 family)